MDVLKTEVSMLAKKMLFAGLIATLAGCGTIGNNVVSDAELARKAAFALDTTADRSPFPIAPAKSPAPSTSLPLPVAASTSAISPQ